MTEPADHAVIRFFANALVGVGWLILGLGGLCTLIFGGLALGGDHEFHVALEDWMLPLSMLAVGGTFLGVGRAIRRAVAPTPPPKAPAQSEGDIDA